MIDLVECGNCRIPGLDPGGLGPESFDNVLDVFIRKYPNRRGTERKSQGEVVGSRNGRNVVE